MALLEVIYKSGIEAHSDFIRAKEIAQKLNDYLNQPEIIDLIKATHKLSAKSGQIQSILIERAKDLGFSSEKKGLFENYALRPDYYMPLDDGQGIIMEVERGKTLANNMDLLDLWKCHICKYANMLFLIIPQYRHNQNGQKKIYKAVLKRLNSFFLSENEVNVDAVFLFGY